MKRKFNLKHRSVQWGVQRDRKIFDVKQNLKKKKEGMKNIVNRIESNQKQNI